MSMIVSANSGGRDFEIHPAGAYAARCVRLIDMGTVDSEWQGKPKKKHVVKFFWETSEIMGDDAGDYAGKPFIVSATFTFNLSEKGKLRPALESWRGRKFTAAELDGFELKAILGKACMLNIVHSDPTTNGKIYANVQSIMPLPNGMTANPPAGSLVYFSLASFDQATYDGLSDYTREKIAGSDEYKALFPARPAGKPVAQTQSRAPATAAIADDDIPF